MNAWLSDVLGKLNAYNASATSPFPGVWSSPASPGTYVINTPWTFNTVQVPDFRDAANQVTSSINNATGQVLGSAAGAFAGQALMPVAAVGLIYLFRKDIRRLIK